jgi:hypothetical protein
MFQILDGAPAEMTGKGLGPGLFQVHHVPELRFSLTLIDIH